MGVFSPQIFLPALPLFIKSLFSNWAPEHSVLNYYYAATFTPFIFLAAWTTLDHIQNRWRISIHALALAGMFLHAFIFLPYWLAPHYPFGGGPSNVLAMQKLVEKIPKDASVISGDFTLTPLVNRKNIFQFDGYLWGNWQVSRPRETSSLNAQYLILNFAEYYRVLNQENREEFISKITEINFGDQWMLEESIEDINLFVRNNSKKKVNRLIEKSFKPFLEMNKEPLKADNFISVEGVEYPKKFNRHLRVFPMIMYWKSLSEANPFYNVLVRIKSGEKISYEKIRPVGSVIYPVNFWKKGEYIKEKYYYLLPQLAPGKYVIEVRVYNSQTYQELKEWVQGLII
jgi:hypothetical protein